MEKVKNTARVNPKAIFKKPEDMLAVWEDYLEAKEKEVIKIHRIHGAHSNHAYEERDAPMSWEDFRDFVNKHPSVKGQTLWPRNLKTYLRDAESEYKREEFFDITDMIRDKIDWYNQRRFIAGMYKSSGMFNTRYTPNAVEPTKVFVTPPTFVAGKELPKD